MEYEAEEQVEEIAVSHEDVMRGDYPISRMV